MRLILKFLKPHWRLCLATILFLAIDVAGALYIPTQAAQILNAGISGDNMDALIKIGAQMVVTTIISGAGAILGGYCCARLTAGIGQDIRNAIYKKSLTLSIYDFRQFGTASMTTRTVADIVNIQAAMTYCLQMVLPVPIMFVIALSLAFSIDTLMGVLLLAVMIGLSVFAFFIVRSASPLFRKLQKHLDKMVAVLRENITGVRVIRAFNKESAEEKRLDNSFSDYAKTSIGANRKFAHLDAFSYLMINVFIIAVFWLSGARISVGAFQIGDITALIEYAWLALFYLVMAQMTLLMLPRALECCHRIEEVLEHQPEIRDLVSADENDAAHGDAVLEFKSVSFKYKDAEEYTLKDMSFTCRRGQTTAVIGGTGSGKSTVASLILRFHDVSEGGVLLNGRDIRDMTQHKLRENIAYVQQQAWLFSGTIAENLRFAKANASDDELMHAADVAQAGDFIRSLPDGLNSHVAQGGTNFSGGQKQRLSIARALVKNPDLYIFDDSFSALDFKTDAALRKALKPETSAAAVLIIAQRVSSIADADQIIVLSEGRIAGIGRHDELIESCSVYREIYESQTKEAAEV